MPDASGEQPKSDKPTESLLDFFRIKFAKDASPELIAFLEKPGSRSEIPANLIKPALTLLGISGTISSLSDDQVLECVERSCRSLLKDLNDFKAGGKQQIAERAKNAVTRLSICLQSPAAIRAAMSTPAAPTVAKVLPQAAPLPAAKTPVAAAIVPSPVAAAAPIVAPTNPIIPALKSAPKKKPGSSGALLGVGGGSLAVVVAIGAVVYFATQNKPPVQTAQAVRPAEPKTPPAIAPVKVEQKTATPTIPTVAPPNPPAISPNTTPPEAIPSTQLPDATPDPPATDKVVIPQPATPPQTPDVVSPPDPPAGAANPDNTAPAAKKVEIDKAEFDRMRTSLREAVKDTADAEKVDAIIAFAGDPEIIKSPAAMKAVLAEALVQSLTTKDVRRAQTTLRRIHDSAELFAESEYKASVSRVKDLAVASGERALAFTLIDELRERQLLSPLETFAEKAAALNTAAQDKSLKKSGNQAQRQELADEMVTLAVAAAEVHPEVAEDLLVEARKTAGAITDRERRAAFEKEISVAKATVTEAKRYQLALETLKKDPQDASAQKVRIDVLLNRGQAKEVLADLAGSEHPLQSLAQETASLLQQGSNPSGKTSFSCAQRWAKAADEAQGPKQAGFQQLARELTTLAISAQNDPLDPFALQRAKQLEATFSSNAPAVAARPTSPKPNSNDSKSKVELISSGAKTSVVKGKVDRTKDAIVADRGLFEFDQELTERSYRLVAKFARTGGGDTLGFTVPVGTSAVTVVFGCYNNTTHGLSDLEQGGPDRNPTGVRGTIDNNRVYTAQIDVQQVTDTDYHIVVLLDGAKVIDWQGSQDRLVPSGRTEYAARSPRKLAAGATKATMEVRSLELSVPTVAPSETTKGKPLPLNKWVDLFPLVDFDQDRELGYWTPGPRNTIQVEPYILSRIRMPVLLANCSYDLVTEFSLGEDHEEIHMILPVGERSVMVVVDATRPTPVSFFETISGRFVHDNPGAVRADLLRPNQVHRYEANVRLNGDRAQLTFSLNGKKQFEHEGLIAQLETHPDYNLQTKAQPGLAANNTPASFSSCQVRPVSGEASLGRDAPLLEQIPAKILAMKATPLTSLNPMDLKYHDVHFGISKGTRNPFLGGKECTDYIFAHAPSRITYAIPPKAKYFTAVAYCVMSSHVNFVVKVDGKELFSRARRPITPVVVELPAGGKVLELECDDLGGLARDHSSWCYPAFR